MNTFLQEGYIVLQCEPRQTSLEETILPLLPAGYRFLNYKYTIHGPALITYHRDVTSSQSSIHTKYPTYTAIQYEYEGDFLSVSPGSHQRWQFGFPKTIHGKRYTVVLFNCDLVHGGLDAAPGVDRKAIQYKIAHETDIPLLQELQGIDVIQEGKQIHPISKFGLRVASYLFVVPIERFCRPLLQRRFSTGVSSFLQTMFPLQYFNTPQGNYKKV